MDTINQAIELSENKCPEEDWALVNVGIAPSTITITFNDSRYGFKLNVNNNNFWCQPF